MRNDAGMRRPNLKSSPVTWTNRLTARMRPCNARVLEASDVPAGMNALGAMAARRDFTRVAKMAIGSTSRRDHDVGRHIFRHVREIRAASVFVTVENQWCAW